MARTYLIFGDIEGKLDVLQAPTSPRLPMCPKCGARAVGHHQRARTKAGWTVGGGLEAMLWSSWLVRGEYRYDDFGTTTTEARTVGTFARVVRREVLIALAKPE